MCVYQLLQYLPMQSHQVHPYLEHAGGKQRPSSPPTASLCDAWNCFCSRLYSYWYVVVFSVSAISSSWFWFPPQASLTNSDVIFLKLHAPWDVLCRYAELMNIRMPFRWDNSQQTTNIHSIVLSWKKIPTYKRYHAEFCCEININSVNIHNGKIHFLPQRRFPTQTFH